MRSPLFVLVAGCSALFGIIVFCVMVGGYSSFSRAQGRIENSKSLLTKACQNRLDLLPELFEISKNTQLESALPMMNSIAEKAALVLQQVESEKPPLDTDLVKDFELSQAHLTQKLTDLLAQVEASIEQKDEKQFNALKQKLYAVQDNIFVIWKSYNTEVVYFNVRTVTFPNFLIAKLLGFNKLHYNELSEDGFLPVRKTFERQTS